MIQLQKLTVIGLFVWLAASPRARSQALPGNQPSPQGAKANSPAQTESGQVAPSDSVFLSRGTVQGGHHTPSTGVRRSANAGGIRSSLTEGAIADEMPRLCFQPGIGWQHFPMAGFGVSGKLDAIDNSVGGNLATMKASNFASGGSSKSVFAEPSGSTRATSNQCPGIVRKTMVPGTAVEDLKVSNNAQMMSSGRLTSMNAGTQDWLQTDSVLNPASSAASGRSLMGLSLGSSSGTHSSDNRSFVSGDQTEGFHALAYKSPIKIRRLMRQAPDLQGRIKLRELTDSLARSSRTSSNIMGGKKAREAQLRNRHGTRTHSAAMSGGRDHPFHSTNTSSSHSYP